MRKTSGPTSAKGAAPDLRMGEPWTASQRLKNDLLWALAMAALGATRSLSLRILRQLGSHLGSAAHALLAPARATARANVARVFADRAEADRRSLVRRCFVTLGEALGETVALLRVDDRPEPIPVDPEAVQLLRGLSATKAGRGVLFASAHLGSWELVAASLVTAGIPLVALARKSYDPRLSWVYERIRSRSGVRVLWRDDRTAPFRVVGALRNGAVLGVPMDLRSRVECRDVPFLGHRAPTPIGPACIALRTRSPVVVGSLAPGRGGGPIVTVSPIVASDLEPTEAGALELTTRINAEISRRILALPHAWVWMHERWTAGAEI